MVAVTRWTFGVTNEDKMDSDFPDFRVGYQTEFAVLTRPEELARPKGKPRQQSISHVHLNEYFVTAVVSELDGSGDAVWRLKAGVEFTGHVSRHSKPPQPQPGNIVCGNTRLWIAGDYWAELRLPVYTWAIRRIRTMVRLESSISYRDVDYGPFGGSDYLVSCELVPGKPPK